MDVAAWIVESVREGATQGSHLAQRVRSKYPDWTPQQAGARNLRDFVERFVDGVRVVGRAGMDVIYGLSAEAPGAAAPKPAGAGQDVNFWRVWVSPNSPYALAINNVTGSVGHLPREASPEAGLSRLEPAPRARHEEIAREFARRVQAERGIRLPDVGGAEGWRYDWQRSLKSVGLEPEWNEHRSSALEAQLRVNLRDLGLSDEAQQQALTIILRDRTARGRTTTHAPRAIEDTRTELEAIVLAAVPRMDVSDLRALKIPLGVVLDVVAQRLAK